MVVTSRTPIGRSLLAQHISDTTPRLSERDTSRMSATFVVVGWLGLIVLLVARGCS